MKNIKYNTNLLIEQCSRIHTKSLIRETDDYVVSQETVSKKRQVVVVGIINRAFNCFKGEMKRRIQRKS